MHSEMHTEPQTVEKGAGAEYAIMGGDHSRNIGKRIGRIGDGDKHCLRSGAHDFWNHVAIDRSVLFQKSQPALAVATVGGTAGLFVDAGRDQNHAGTA